MTEDRDFFLGDVSSETEQDYGVMTEEKFPNFDFFLGDVSSEGQHHHDFYDDDDVHDVFCCCC